MLETISTTVLEAINLLSLNDADNFLMLNYYYFSFHAFVNRRLTSDILHFLHMFIDYIIHQTDVGYSVTTEHTDVVQRDTTYR